METEAEIVVNHCAEKDHGDEAFNGLSRFDSVVGAAKGLGKGSQTHEMLRKQCRKVPRLEHCRTCWDDENS